MRLNIWATIVVFGALYYLDAGLFKSGLVAAFFFISCSIGFGRRWLIPAGFVVAILGIAVFLGFPHPSGWWGPTTITPQTVSNSK
jgi:hypothetical protein